ncbi:MAG: hypothetical protein F6K17_24935 [Okeania sp. SIO3C4]|nr:hypothetical protein [Okeania sp. SIO3B3]NER05599.1 hypothetical protein [Okeania sp. SIO3C4]
MDIDSLFSTLKTEAEDTNDLFSLSNHKTNYSDTTSDILLQNLTPEDYTNSAEDWFSSQDLVANKLESIFTDSSSVKNPEIDSITGDRPDLNNIQLRAAKKSDNSIKTATEIDIISDDKIRINDRIGYKESGKADKYDYYSFSLSEDAEVSI